MRRHRRPDDEVVDPPAHRVGPDFPWWNRDQCRAPMPWTDGHEAGFTSGRPWLPLPPDAATRNAAGQRSDPDSVFGTYRRLLDLRRATPALHRGGLRQLDPGAADGLAWQRLDPAGDALVLANLADAPSTLEPRDAPGGSWRVAGGTHDRVIGEPIDPARLDLTALEAVILVPAP